MSNYIVKTAAAAMPNSCWGTYRRVAVIEVQDGVTDVAMISSRARGVINIVATWEKLNVGQTSRCAYRRALAEAQQMAADLNSSGNASDAVISA